MQITNIKNSGEASEAIVTILNDLCASKVLFMIAGGSAAKVGVDALKMLSNDQLTNICVTLTDERYGVVGHDESNWVLLEELGLPDATTKMPVLIGDELESTTEKWDAELQRMLLDHKVIGLFGIGADGHIAGIKPDYDLGVGYLAKGYRAADFMRITLSPKMFSMIDFGFAYAEGIEKEPIVQQILNENDQSSQPMQLIKDTKQHVVYYCK